MMSDKIDNIMVFEALHPGKAPIDIMSRVFGMQNLEKCDTFLKWLESMVSMSDGYVYAFHIQSGLYVDERKYGRPTSICKGYSPVINGIDTPFCSFNPRKNHIFGYVRINNNESTWFFTNRITDICGYIDRNNCYTIDEEFLTKDS